MKQPWVYMCSPSRSPLPPPSLPDPSRSSQCTRSELLASFNLEHFYSVSLSSVTLHFEIIQLPPPLVFFNRVFLVLSLFPGDEFQALHFGVKYGLSDESF